LEASALLAAAAGWLGHGGAHTVSLGHWLAQSPVEKSRQTQSAPNDAQSASPEQA
jgi:hypothetical protein